MRLAARSRTRWTRWLARVTEKGGLWTGSGSFMAELRRRRSGMGILQAHHVALRMEPGIPRHGLTTASNRPAVRRERSTGLVAAPRERPRRLKSQRRRSRFAVAIGGPERGGATAAAKPGDQHALAVTARPCRPLPEQPYETADRCGRYVINESFVNFWFQ